MHIQRDKMRDRRPLSEELLEQLSEMDIDPEDAEFMMAVAEVPADVREHYYASTPDPSELGLLRHWRKLSDG
jgi:hypothetical protein